MEKIVTKSENETKSLAQKFARLNLQQGSTLTRVIALYGDLGSGKTTFVQGLAEGIGIKQRIISPTFIIVRQYKISPPRSLFIHLGGGEATTSTPARCNTFYHIDLYRIETEKELEGLGIEETLNDKNAIIVIEWAEKLGELLPKQRIDICFEHFSKHERKITIYG